MPPFAEALILYAFLGGAAGCRPEEGEEDENEVAEDNVSVVSALMAVVVLIAMAGSVFTDELTAAASAPGGVVAVVSTTTREVELVMAFVP